MKKKLEGVPLNRCGCSACMAARRSRSFTPQTQSFNKPANADANAPKQKMGRLRRAWHWLLRANNPWKYAERKDV